MVGGTCCTIDSPGSLELAAACPDAGFTCFFNFILTGFNCTATCVSSCGLLSVLISSPPVSPTIFQRVTNPSSLNGTSEPRAPPIACTNPAGENALTPGLLI